MTGGEKFVESGGVFGEKFDSTSWRVFQHLLDLRLVDAISRRTNALERRSACVEQTGEGTDSWVAGTRFDPRDCGLCDLGSECEFALREPSDRPSGSEGVRNLHTADSVSASEQGRSEAPRSNFTVGGGPLRNELLRECLQVFRRGVDIYGPKGTCAVVPHPISAESAIA